MYHKGLGPWRMVKKKRKFACPVGCWDDLTWAHPGWSTQQLVLMSDLPVVVAGNGQPCWEQELEHLRSGCPTPYNRCCWEGPHLAIKFVSSSAAIHTSFEFKGPQGLDVTGVDWSEDLKGPLSLHKVTCLRVRHPYAHHPTATVREVSTPPWDRLLPFLPH